MEGEEEEEEGWRGSEIEAAGRGLIVEVKSEWHSQLCLMS